MARRRVEKGAMRKVKKRHLKELPPDIRAEVVRLYLEEHIMQREIASRFRIS